MTNVKSSPRFLLILATLVCVVTISTNSTASAEEIEWADGGESQLLLDAPELLSPANGATNLPRSLHLDWREVADAEYYDVELSSTLGIDVVSVNFGTWLLPNELGESEAYSWRVRAANTNGVGPWSGSYSFETGTSAFGFGASMQFTAVSNAAGVLNPPEMAAFGFNDSGFPSYNGHDRPDGLRSQSNGATWGVHAATESSLFGPIENADSFLGMVSNSGESINEIFPNDFEIRFTADGGMAALDGGGGTITVPFELWSIGRNSPDDSSDDHRMIPVVMDKDASGQFDVSGDHVISGNVNDPFSDWISWYHPATLTAGSAGYDDFFSGASTQLGTVVFHNMVLVNWNGGSELPYDADMPEVGTVIRIETGEEQYTTGPTIPMRLAPADDALVDAGLIDLFWTEPGLGTAQFQLAVDAQFTKILADSEVSGRKHTISLEANGVYYWRVRSESSDWSNTWTIEVQNGIGSVGTEAAEAGLQEARLYSNFPNPFSNVTTITFETSTSSPALLEVFDLMGRRVSTLLDQTVSVGTHDVQFDGSTLLSGVYFYRMKAGDTTETKRLTILR